MRSPARSRRKVVRKDQLPFFKRSLYNWVCVSRRSSEKIYSTERRVHREESFKSVYLMSEVLAHPGLRRGHKTKPWNKKDAPAEKHGIWRKMSTSSKNTIKALFFSPTETRATPAPISKSLQEVRIRNRLRSVDAHAEQKKGLSSGEVETLRRSRNTITMVTANGEVQTNEEAQYTFIDLFVTVQILDDTSADLSLGKRCEEHGYSHEWASGQKPRLTKTRGKTRCKTENFVLVVFPGLSSNPGTSSSST